MEHKSEIEVADFDRLLSKLELIQVNPATKDLLIRIKESGQPKVLLFDCTTIWNFKFRFGIALICMGLRQILETNVQSP